MTTAHAFISGSGVITVTGAVLVISRGIAKAYAVVRGAAIAISGVKVALNASAATVSAIQDAYISGVSLAAASVEVSAFLNDADDTGALAVVGSTGAQPGVSFSFISGKVSVATALVSAHSYAYISGAALAVSGAVTVTNTARSYANADILDSQFSISVLNVSLLVTYAYAQGDFASYVQAEAGRAMLVGSISVSTVYYAISTAATGAAGGGRRFACQRGLQRGGSVQPCRRVQFHPRRGRDHLARQRNRNDGRVRLFRGDRPDAPVHRGRFERGGQHCGARVSPSSSPPMWTRAVRSGLRTAR